MCAYVDFVCYEFFLTLLACAGNQCGTPVFFLADAPARYNAWDEFVLCSFYRLIAPSGNEFGAPVSFFAMRRRRIMYNAWDEFVFIVFIDFWLREVMNLVPLFLLLRIRRRRIMHGMNLFLIDL